MIRPKIYTIKSGDWNDPSVWSEGKVPEDYPKDNDTLNVEVTIKHTINIIKGL